MLNLSLLVYKTEIKLISFQWFVKTGAEIYFPNENACKKFIVRYAFKGCEVKEIITM